MRSGLCAVGLSLVFGSGASGAYIMTPTSNGLSARTIVPGGSFTLDLVLATTASDQINSAIARVLFSDAGLQMDSYDWSMPFENGSITDDSSPIDGDLPVLLDEDTLSGIGYPNGVVDVELSNVILSADRFADGILVSLNFTVPLDYMGEEEIVITAVPDTLADGFTEIDTLPGSSFTLTIPSPGSLAIAGIAGLVSMRRRRW